MYKHKEADRIPISVDNSPRYDAHIIEENDKYRIYTTKWGATKIVGGFGIMRGVFNE